MFNCTKIVVSNFKYVDHELSKPPTSVCLKPDAINSKLKSSGWWMLLRFHHQLFCSVANDLIRPFQRNTVDSSDGILHTIQSKKVCFYVYLNNVYGSKPAFQSSLSTWQANTFVNIEYTKLRTFIIDHNSIEILCHNLSFPANWTKQTKAQKLKCQCICHFSR